MVWFYLLCAALIIIIALLVKIALMHKAVDEIRTEIKARPELDTNTLISISGNDRHIKALAAELNIRLRVLRKEHRRLKNGDLELKEAITNISHDLRTPLTAICGYLDLLKKEEKSVEVKRCLDIIENRTGALKQLTEELFKYSLIASAGKELVIEDIVINDVLEESISAYYAVLKNRKIYPDIYITEHKIQRRLDKDCLARVFENIIGNAIKYSNGDLAIELTDDSRITFTNTAAQLNEIQVGKLFDRFYTVESARKSTGLGLAIAKQLVEQMNGTISAEYQNERLSIHICFK